MGNKVIITRSGDQNVSDVVWRLRRTGMRKNILAAFILILVISCNRENKLSESRDFNTYPRLVDSLGLKQLYDEAKWFLYCYSFDDTLKFYKVNDSCRRCTYSTSYTFGMVDYVFDTILFDGGELKINFKIRKEYGDSAISFNDYWAFDGVGFDLKSNNIINLYRVDAGLSLTLNFLKNTFRDNTFVPRPSKYGERARGYLSPDVKKSIMENTCNLDPWFVLEAVKRGIVPISMTFFSNPPQSLLERNHLSE